MNKYDAYDLSDWYPFLPKEGFMDAVATWTLAACIRIELDAGDDIFEAAEKGEPLFSKASVVLIALNPDYATVRVEGALFPSGFKDIEVPIYVGDNAVSDFSESWIIMSQLPENMQFCNLELDPSCLMFIQKPPKVELGKRYDVDIDEVAGGTGYVDLGAVRDGHNVSVELIGSTLTFTAGSDLGKGVYNTPPYTVPAGEDPLEYKAAGGQRGMRSINGVTDAVNIAESPSISVNVSKDLNNNVTIKVAPGVLLP